MAGSSDFTSSVVLLSAACAVVGSDFFVPSRPPNNPSKSPPNLSLSLSAIFALISSLALSLNKLAKSTVGFGLSKLPVILTGIVRPFRLASSSPPCPEIEPTMDTLSP